MGTIYTTKAALAAALEETLGKHGLIKMLFKLKTLNMIWLYLETIDAIKTETQQGFVSLRCRPWLPFSIFRYLQHNTH